MDKIVLIATCPMGLEAIVARELKDLGYSDQKVENGRVVFQGDAAAICRTNLWMRTADRILIKMGEFQALTFDDLFEGTKSMSWPDWIPERAEFPVNGRSHKSMLSSVPACQGIVKKAIVEKMKERYHTDWFPEDGARYVIEVSLLNDIATLTIDTTGYSLHKRGYRKLAAEAPIKETMAAALVLLSRWRLGRPLHDPFCGSGTILIEAAMIAWNIAPGLRRSFPFEEWGMIDNQVWEDTREEAYDAVKDDEPLQITGSDLDPKAIELAEQSIKSAGLGKEIKLLVQSAARIQLEGNYGCVITNPPYGERLGTEKEADQAAGFLGLLAATNPTWSFFAISPDQQLQHYFGRDADKKRKLYNGRIECTFYSYFGPLPPRGDRV